MKSAVAPPTSTVAPGGAGSARIRFTVSWLASEMNGLAEIAWIAVTPPRSGCGGGDFGDPVDPAHPRRQRRRGLRAAASTAIQIGVSW